MDNLFFEHPSVAMKTNLWNFGITPFVHGEDKEFVMVIMVSRRSITS